MAGLANAAIVQASLDDMAKQVPVDAPWTAAKAAEWDRQTFESWLRANAVVPSAKFLLDVACTVAELGFIVALLGLLPARLARRTGTALALIGLGLWAARFWGLLL